MRPKGDTATEGLQIDPTFPRSYECKQLAEMPGSQSLPHHNFSGAALKNDRDGIILEVRPEHGKPWIGTFAFGNIAPNSLSGIFTTPDPARLCIVARGEGYIVTANAPDKWERVDVAPIFDVRSISKNGLIIFASFTRLIAYGTTGLKWKTKDLTWDDLKIKDVTDSSILGEFWDTPDQATATFIVSLTDGTHEGGIQKPRGRPA